MSEFSEGRPPVPVPGAVLEPVDVPGYLSRLSVDLATMHDGYTDHERFVKQVSAITELVSAVHTQEVVQERDKLWRNVAAVAQMGEPFQIDYRGNFERAHGHTVHTVWRFHDFSQPLAGQSSTESSSKGVPGDRPADLELHAWLLMDSASVDVFKGIRDALDLARAEKTFPAHRIPRPVLGIEAEKLDRNKFRFNATALRIQVGETVLTHATSVDATLFSSYDHSRGAGQPCFKQTLQRRDYFGIDGTAAWLRLESPDVQFDPEDVFANICDEVRDSDVTTIEEAYDHLYRTYIRDQKAQLANYRVINDWLQQDLVAPVTTGSFATATSR